MRTFAALILLGTSAWAHMQLNYPSPFNASNNPHAEGDGDPYLQYPYNCCGRTETRPCKGYLGLLGTPAGAPVATWAAGSTQWFNISGIGNHYGGSCQVGFSVDGGQSFQVAKSYEGNCPHRDAGSDAAGQNFNFTVPEDIPTGNVVFAWTWFNREQEFNMNCAAVTITGGESQPPPPPPPPEASPTSTAPPTPTQSSYTDSNGCNCVCPAFPAQAAATDGGMNPKPSYRYHPSKRSVAYHARPAMLIADTIDTKCKTPKTTAEVKFRNPGPDVEEGDGAYPLEMPGPEDAC